ncbi:helix-turn-helix domain-containing protein [Epilithonimonas zeae]|uniref:Putative DNA-binding domain-containing protein n=1 Tax=Epilithonimonas zeae TaxID=1416779 RepID=A0A1N6G8M0_9FLAO|nr:ATP-binding protein [Epilithonimonas zeae]SIO03857.1 Putative DNA-binding domain-containing protein [Epilithonimonas zeae]
MDNFYLKEEYTFEDIENLILNEVEESIYLDFKDAPALDKSDGKRKEIAKDISAFANSEGGIIIYGIQENNHKASAINFIDGNIYTKEWIEQVINSSIQRRISNINIYPIRKSQNINETIYLIKIPKSLDAPHLSKDKRFYKRFNFESVMMEEYEIRNSYGRKLKSKLQIDDIKFQLLDQNESVFTLQIEIFAGNDGDMVEKDYKLNLYFINCPDVNLHWDIRDPNNYHYTEINDTKIKVSSNSISPIYPNESVTILRIKWKINKSNLVEIFEKLKIETILYFSAGEFRKEVDENYKMNIYEYLCKNNESINGN